MPRTKALVVAVIVAAVVVVIVVVSGLRALERGEELRDTRTSERAAVTATRILSAEPVESLRLSLQALDGATRDSRKESDFAARVALNGAGILKVLRSQPGYGAVGVAGEHLVALSRLDGGGFSVVDSESGAASATVTTSGAVPGGSAGVAVDDGGRVLAGALGREAGVWELASGRRIATARGHKGRITDLALNSSGTTLVTTSSDGSTRVANVATGETLYATAPHLNVPTLAVACTILEEQDVCATGDALGDLRLFALATGRDLRSWRLPSAITDLAFAPNAFGGAERLGAVTTAGAVRIWDTQHWTTTARLRVGPDATDLALDEDHVAVADRDEVTVWNANGTQLRARLPITVDDLVFLSARNELVTSSASGAVIVWDVRYDAFQDAAEQAVPAAAPITALGFGTTTTGRVWGSADGVVRLGNGSFPGPPQYDPPRWEVNIGAPPAALQFAQRDAQLYCVDENNVLTILKTTDGTALARHQLGEGAVAVAVAANAGVLARLDHEGRVATARVTSERRLKWTSLERPSGLRLNLIAVSSDGALIAASRPGEILIWDARTAALKSRFAVWQPQTLEPTAVSLLAFAPDGSQLVVGNEDGGLLLVSTMSPNSGAIELYGLRRPAYQGIFRPSGGLLVTSGEDGEVVLWDTEAGQIIDVLSQPTRPKPPQTEDAPEFALAFSRTSAELAVGQRSGSVRTAPCPACRDDIELAPALRALLDVRTSRSPLPSGLLP